MPTTTSEVRPFKKFFCDDRAVFRLPGNAVKLWLYYYAREGPERRSWPTAETICTDLGINQNTLFRWRAFLVEYGWLKKVGDHRRQDGEFSVPEFAVKRGTVPEKIGDGTDKRSTNRIPKKCVRTHMKTSGASHPKFSGTDPHENFGDEVDSGLLDSEEVDSGKSDNESWHNLTPVEFGRRLLEEVGLPYSGNITVVADAIAAEAKYSHVSEWKAYEQILAQAKSDQKTGRVRVDHFYFQNAKHRNVAVPVSEGGLPPGYEPLSVKVRREFEARKAAWEAEQKKAAQP
jgi:hypothetical protein